MIINKKEPIKSRRKDISHEPSAYFNRLAEMKARRGNISHNTLYQKSREKKEKSLRKKTFKIKKQNFFLNRKSLDNTPKKSEKTNKSARFGFEFRKSASENNLKEYRDVKKFFLTKFILEIQKSFRFL